MRLTLLETAQALIALARLGVITRFRFGGAYWRWRRATAFGSRERSLPLRERIHAALEYGAWVARMRRVSS
jgi:hypothetical protein